MSSVTKPSTSDATPDTAPPPPPPRRAGSTPDVGGGVMVTQLLEVALGAPVCPAVCSTARARARSWPEMTGLHEPSLYRVLRALTMFGHSSTEQPERRFTLGPLGPTAAEYEDGFRWGVAAVNELPRTVQDGTPGMELAHGMSFFDYLTQHPAAGRNFERGVEPDERGGARGGRRELRLRRRAHAGRCRRRRRDRTGGDAGASCAPARRAVQPAGGDRASSPGAGRAGDRCEVVGGDFFESIPHMATRTCSPTSFTTRTRNAP